MTSLRPGDVVTSNREKHPTKYPSVVIGKVKLYSGVSVTMRTERSLSTAYQHERRLVARPIIT